MSLPLHEKKKKQKKKMNWYGAPILRAVEGIIFGRVLATLYKYSNLHDASL